MRSAETIQTIGVVGCGLIGVGWIATFLSRDFNVVAFDAAPDVEQKTRDQLDRIWPDLEQLGLTEGASRERLTFSPSLKALSKQADFIQENIPDYLDAKQNLLQEIDAQTPSDVLISSSTSGFMKAELEQKCQHKDRIIVGHPFFPVHLLPLVEIVASEEAGQIADALYTRAGKAVIVMNKDVPGFIANRFQETMWREALNMIAAGQATPEQIDRALMNGPALRWPFMGPIMSYAMAEGEGGMRKLISLIEEEGPYGDDWTPLPMQPITPAMKEALISETDTLFEGKSFQELLKERDRRIIAILKARNA
ncbi:MAG: 3-hydroxyacyl-CoA dehydrogenase NAD-binding domain-containing protein [Pseudomonadota bacterium]